MQTAHLGLHHFTLADPGNKALRRRALELVDESHHLIENAEYDFGGLLKVGVMTSLSRRAFLALAHLLQHANARVPDVWQECREIAASRRARGHHSKGLDLHGSEASEAGPADEATAEEGEAPSANAAADEGAAAAEAMDVTDSPSGKGGSREANATPGEDGAGVAAAAATAEADNIAATEPLAAAAGGPGSRANENADAAEEEGGGAAAAPAAAEVQDDEEKGGRKAFGPAREGRHSVELWCSPRRFFFFAFAQCSLWRRAGWHSGQRRWRR